MTLNERTSLGLITVNDNVIAKIILRAAEKAEGRLLLSSEKGRVLGVASRVGVGDVLGNFSIRAEEGRYILRFSGVILFGSSIRWVSETVLDAVAEEMKSFFPQYGGEVILHIVGIKSRQIAMRDIEVKREYEAAR